MESQLDIMKLKLEIPDDSEDNLLKAYLDDAKWVILTRRYPFGAPSDTLEPQYESLQVRIAIELYSKGGAEGQTSHSEGDVSRNYESAGVSPSLLQEITPMAKVL